MPDHYTPPFTMTDEILNMVIEIGELVGQIDVLNHLSANLKLRRENRIKTIYSSLAIEQNTLTLEQVTDIIDGKRVLAPPNEILEVKNAYDAYNLLPNLDMYSVKDLLRVHKVMTAGLMKESGVFRSGNAGVYDHNHALIHIQAWHLWRHREHTTFPFCPAARFRVLWRIDPWGVPVWINLFWHQ